MYQLVVEPSKYYEVMELLRFHEDLHLIICQSYMRRIYDTYGSVCSFIFIWKETVSSGEGEVG